MTEAVLPLEMLVWGGVFAPPGMPPDIMDRLNAAISKVGSTPPLSDRLADLGSSPFEGDRVSFGKFFAAETARWAEVVRAPQAQVN